MQFTVPKEFALDAKSRNLVEVVLTEEPDPTNGTINNFWFRGELVVKSPKEYSQRSPEWQKDRDHSYIRGALASRHLRSNGVNTPEVFGLGQVNGIPYMVMERLDLVEIHKKDVSKRQRISRWLEGFTEARIRKEYNEQLRRVRRLGHYPFDIEDRTNAGIANGKIYLYDLDFWGAPRHIEDQAKACFTTKELSR